MLMHLGACVWNEASSLQGELQVSFKINNVHDLNQQSHLRRVPCRHTHRNATVYERSCPEWDTLTFCQP